MSQRLASVTITVVANGWMVQPATYRDTGSMDKIMVFQTFEALSKWLKEHVRQQEDS